MLATGQTACWDASGVVIPCAGTGQDGEIRAGLPLAYQDNGDGTVTDRNTGLMWEKLDDNDMGGIHDYSDYYLWEDAFEVKIAALNMQPCFAGHCDWRLPNVRELGSIANYGSFVPAVSSAFNDGCVPGCTAETCSCTEAVYLSYWASTTDANNPQKAFAASFFDGISGSGSGSLTLIFKDSAFNGVRAVRGGL